MLGAEVNLLTLADGAAGGPAPAVRATRADRSAWSLPGALAGVAVLRALDAVALQLRVTAGVLVSARRPLRAARRRRPHVPPRRAGRARRRPARGRADHLDHHRRAAARAASCSAAARRPAGVRDTLTVVFLGLSRRWAPSALC